MAVSVSMSLAVLVGHAASLTWVGARRPNILVMLADDLGYGDLGCFGRENISTPHLDGLAASGIRFTQWVSAAAICTPSRAALQTGRLPRRYGMTANVLPWRVFDFPSQPGGLPASEVTIATALKAGGYRSGMSGKWHLGVNAPNNPGGHLPRKHGYDDWLGLPFTNMEQCAMGKESKTFCMLMANTTVVEQPTRMQNLTLELTDHAVRFIATAAAQKVPFFFLMSYVHVHTALFSSPAFTGISRGGEFGDNLEELDWSVGQLLAALDNHGLASNTAVFFTSDNGPYAEEGWDKCGRTGGLKGSKGQTWEGGVRVPGIVRFPGVTPMGVVTDTLVSTLDIFPTALTLAGVEVPAGLLLDGKDMTPVLRNPTQMVSPHRTFFHFCGKNVTAVRLGNLKIHFATQKWDSVSRTTSKCTMCCPYGPTSFNGTGGSMCDCGWGDLNHHDPPLVFNISEDKYESTPLNRISLPTFDSDVAAAKNALAALYNTLSPVPDQMHTLPNIKLQPCCDGHSPFGKCECRDFIEGKSYP